MMKKLRSWVLLLGIAATAALANGCGGGDEGDDVGSAGAGGSNAGGTTSTGANSAGGVDPSGGGGGSGASGGNPTAGASSGGAPAGGGTSAGGSPAGTGGSASGAGGVSGSGGRAGGGSGEGGSGGSSDTGGFTALGGSSGSAGSTALGGSGGSGGPEPATAFEVMTWVPSYSQNNWKRALEADTGGAYNPRNTLTRVATQFFQVQSDGGLHQGVDDSDVEWIADYTSANGIKFLICVHNYVDGWNWGVASSAFANNQSTLVNSIMDLVDRWGADGVDIDFEGNEGGSPYRSEFADFIQELGTRLHADGKELTVDVFPYIWNQPSSEWWSDWVGYADGVNSMGYDALFGGADDWGSYRWQQDTALEAGYEPREFDMGMPGWAGDWGYGGLGTSVMDHLNELLSGDFNTQPTSVCIWDAQFRGDGWMSADVWEALHRIREGDFGH